MFLLAINPTMPWFEFANQSLCVISGMHDALHQHVHEFRGHTGSGPKRAEFVKLAYCEMLLSASMKVTKHTRSSCLIY